MDLDNTCDPLVEDNVIIGNGDDGIEIRLHPYVGPTLTIIIRNNLISCNEEDGIQIIEHHNQPLPTDRVLWIENNLILNSFDAGLGLMDDGDTVEDFRAANIEEPINVIGNTFVNNPYGISGGDNLVAVNNLIVGSSSWL